MVMRHDRLVQKIAFLKTKFLLTKYNKDRTKLEDILVI